MRKPVSIETSKSRPLPPGWQWVRLGEVCTINPPRPREMARSPEAATTFVPMEAVSDYLGKIVRPQIRPYQEVMKGYTYFEEGDIIWAKITPCMENGKSAIACCLLDGIAFGSTEFHVIRPGPDILPEFVWYFVRQPQFRLEATQHFVGAVGQQRVPDTYLRKALLPLPPLSEQRAIVTRLEAQMAEVDRLRTAAERQLEAARALFGALLRQVFRYKEGEALPPGWRWVRLGNILTLKYGDSLPEYSRKGGTVPVFGSNGIVGYHSVSITKGKTIIVGRKGSVGEVNFSEVACWPIDTTYYIDETSEPADFRWLFWQLKFLNLPKLNKSAAIPGLNRDDVYALRVTLPPLPDQHAIVARLEAQMAEVARLRAALERQLKAARALPGALLNEVFGGFQPPAGSEPAGGYAR